jgi:serine/threonine protein kinase/tetratricopeptide (TPR) repeat protein
MNIDRADEIFRACCDIPLGERDAAIVQQCRGDQSLLREVRELFGADDLNRSMFEGQESDVSELLLAPGVRVGPFRLVREIDRGSFGVVWLAESIDTTRGSIALKIFRVSGSQTGWDYRLRKEPRLLSRIGSNYVGSLISYGVSVPSRDGVATPSPDVEVAWVAMEYVEGGSPITSFVKDNALTLRQRLELMVKVCKGVSDAHHALVAHRDLKPANILVRFAKSDDASAAAGGADVPTPTILDFGLARSREDLPVPEPVAGTKRVVHTAMGSMTVGTMAVGSPPYCSPEQASPVISPADAPRPAAVPIAAREELSDIYSLGAVLFEVLTGQKPFANTNAFQDAMERDDRSGMLRIIRDEDPEHPAKAATRDAKHVQFASTLAGDLGSIVVKAMAKDPSHRYAAASEMRRDLLNWLEQRPVEAANGGAWYKTRKLIRRNPLGSTLALVSLSLVVIAYFSSVVLRRAASDALSREQATHVKFEQTLSILSESLSHQGIQRVSVAFEREILNRLRASLSSRGLPQEEISRQLSEFTRHLAISDSSTALREAVTRGSVDLAIILFTKHDVPPEVSHRSLLNLADQLSDAEMNDDAHRVILLALSVAEREFGLLSPQYIETLEQVAASHLVVGNEAEGLRLLKEAEPDLRRILGEDHPRTLSAQLLLADRTRDKKERLSKLERLEAQFIASSRAAPNDRAAFWLAILGAAYAAGDVTKATQVARAHVEAVLAEPGVTTREAIMFVGNTSFLESVAGNTDRSIALRRFAYEGAKALNGRGSRQAIVQANSLAALYWNVSQYEAAESLMWDVHADIEYAAPYSVEAAKIMTDLGMAVAKLDRFDEADWFFTRAKQRLLDIGASNDAEYFRALDAISQNQLILSDDETRIASAQELVEYCSANDPEGKQFSTASANHTLASAWRLAGRYDLAEVPSRRAMELVVKFPEQRGSIDSIRAMLADTLSKLGKHDEALCLRRELFPNGVGPIADNEALHQLAGRIQHAAVLIRSGDPDLGLAILLPAVTRSLENRDKGNRILQYLIAMTAVETIDLLFLTDTSHPALELRLKCIEALERLELEMPVTPPILFSERLRAVPTPVRGGVGSSGS